MTRGWDRTDFKIAFCAECAEISIQIFKEKRGILQKFYLVWNTQLCERSYVHTTHSSDCVSCIETTSRQISSANYTHIRVTPVARLRRVSYSTSSRGKFEWQSKWRFEFGVYPPWRLERSKQTVWNSSVSALQQMVTGMARFFKVTGVSNRFKLKSVPSFPPESRKTEIDLRILHCLHCQHSKYTLVLYVRCNDISINCDVLCQW